MPSRWRLLRKMRTFVRQPWGRKVAIVEALTHLILAKTCILRRGQHAAILAYAGGPSSPGTAAVIVDDAAARDVQWALAALARWVPRRHRCLTRALAASRMLSRRGLPWTMTVGVARSDGALLAHASLQCGTRVVTGGHGARQVTRLATYQSSCLTDC